MVALLAIGILTAGLLAWAAMSRNQAPDHRVVPVRIDEQRPRRRH